MRRFLADWSGGVSLAEADHRGEFQRERDPTMHTHPPPLSPAVAHALEKLASQAHVLSLMLASLRKQDQIDPSDPLLCVAGTVAQSQGALIDFVLMTHDLAPQRGAYQDWLLDRDESYLPFRSMDGPPI